MHVMQEARNGMIRLGGVHALFWNRIDISSWRLLLISSNTDHLTYAAEKRVIIHISFQKKKSPSFQRKAGHQQRNTKTSVRAIIRLANKSVNL